MYRFVDGTISVNVLLSFGFGLIFIVAMFVFAVKVPNPTRFSQWVFITVLALAAAGVGSVIPGMLNIDIPYVKAGGAIALFAIVFLLKPAIVDTVATFIPPSISPDAVIASYLNHIDAKDLTAAWNELDPAAQTGVARDQIAYRQAYEAGRDPYGPVESRTMIGFQELQSPSGFPSGIYRQIGYRTKFTSNTCRLEQVLVRSEADQKWRVFEHTVSPSTIPCA